MTDDAPKYKKGDAVRFRPADWTSARFAGVIHDDAPLYYTAFSSGSFVLKTDKGGSLKVGPSGIIREEWLAERVPVGAVREFDPREFLAEGLGCWVDGTNGAVTVTPPRLRGAVVRSDRCYTVFVENPKEPYSNSNTFSSVESIAGVGCYYARVNEADIEPEGGGSAVAV